MRRRIAAATLLVLAAFGSAAATARGPVTLGVAEREFRISTYADAVKRGPVKFNVTNFGQDTHNLVITGPRHFRVKGPDVEPGSRASVSATLRRPGTYYLLCTRANHRKLGMKAKLIVRR
jgi:plastocyanin